MDPRDPQGPFPTQLAVLCPGEVYVFCVHRVPSGQLRE